MEGPEGSRHESGRAGELGGKAGKILGEQESLRREPGGAYGDEKEPNNRKRTTESDQETIRKKQEVPQ